MKKTWSIALCIALAGILSSCNSCLFFVFFYGPDFCELSSYALLSSLDNALYSNTPAAPPRGGQETKTPLPPEQIVEEPISSEPGGGDEEEDSGSTFNDIITSPTFTLGPSLSWLGGDKEDSEKFPARPGFQLGATWQVPISDKIKFEPGLMYASRGLGYESEEYEYYEPGDGPGGSYSYSYGQKKKLHYLELPLSVSGNIMDGLDLYGGPQVAFLLGAKVVNESNGETTSTVKGTEGLNKVDVGLVAGARYQIPNTFFGVALCYYHGFSNLSSSEAEAGYGYDEPKYFTRAIRLGIQYNFPAARSNAKSLSTRQTVKSWLAK